MSVIINGSAGVTTNSGAVYDSLQRATAVTASGTSVDFTSIPSWVRRITVMFNGVSTSGTSNYLVQIGSGSFTTSGYLSGAHSSGNTDGSSTAGFLCTLGTAAAANYYGSVVITNVSGFVYLQTSILSPYTANVGILAGGNVTLSAVLDRVRITTVNGTDTFDAGTINIIYE